MCAYVYVFVFKYSAVNLTHLVSIRYYISVSFFSTQAYNIRYINNSHCIFFKVNCIDQQNKQIYSTYNGRDMTRIWIVKKPAY